MPLDNHLVGPWRYPDLPVAAALSTVRAGVCLRSNVGSISRWITFTTDIWSYLATKGLKVSVEEAELLLYYVYRYLQSTFSRFDVF